MSFKERKIVSGLYYNRRKRKWGLVFSRKFICWFDDFLSGYSGAELFIATRSQRHPEHIRPTFIKWFTERCLGQSQIQDRIDTIAFQETLHQVEKK